MRPPRELNRAATPGYRRLMDEIRMQDFDDPWFTALEWLHAIAGVMLIRFGELLGDFVPSPALSVPVLEQEFPDSLVLDMVDDGEVTEDDLRAVFVVMDRYADWVRLAGLDY